MHVSKIQETQWPKAHQEFYRIFLDSTSPITNRDCLENSPHQANFRQFAEGDMAVGIDLVHVPYGFVIRDFKSAVMGQGNGDVAMACLTEIADNAIARLDLKVFPGQKLDEDGKLMPLIPEAKLIKFYESHRFFLSPREHQLMPEMIRPPQRKWF